MTEPKKVNYEYIGLVVLSFFPLYPFFLVSASIFVYIIFSLISKFNNQTKAIKENYILIGLHLLFFSLLIIRLLFTGNLLEGLRHLQPSYSLLLFPLIWLISDVKISTQERNNLFKYFTLSSFLLGLYILFSSFYFAISTNQNFEIYYEEIKYLSIHPTYVTLYFFAGIIFLFLTFKKRNRRGKIISILIISFFIFMTFLFSSRIVLISLFVIGLVELFKAKTFRFYIKVSILVASILIIISSVFLIKPLHKKVKETISSREFVLPFKKFPTSTQIRLGIYDCALPVIEKNWLFGVGAINFERNIHECYDKYNNFEKIEYNSHNYYLYLLGSSGIFCLISFFLLLYFHFKRALFNVDFFYLYILFGLTIALLTENFLSRIYGVIFTMFFFSVFIKSNLNSKNEE